MTLLIHTTWTAACDGTLSTACDTAHPGRILVRDTGYHGG